MVASATKAPRKARQRTASASRRTLQTCLPRFATQRSARRSYGRQAAQIAAEQGWQLMPWQRLVLDVALEHDAQGHFAYRTVVVTVPRQNGKTLLLWALMLWRALAFERQQIIATAQSGIEAMGKWLEYVEALETGPLSQRVLNVRRSNGSEAITFDTHSRHRVRSPTPKAGHGVTLDLAVIDEAWAMTDEAVLQSMRPAMITRPDAQLWIVSTAGTLDSVLLRRHVDLGRRAVEQGSTDGLAFFEWSAPDDAPGDDPATWRTCMPALGHTITEAVIAEDFAAMAPGERERAYLNRWTDAVETALPLERWRDVLDVEAQPGTGQRVWLGADCTPERSAGAIVAVGRWQDRIAIELIDHREGVDWLPSRIDELVRRHKLAGVVLDAAGPAGGIATQLREPPVLLNHRHVQQASAAFFDGVLYGQIAVRPASSLDAAVRGAAKVGSGDVWRWGRKRSSTDVSPLMAATLALWQVREDKGGDLRIW